MKKRFCYGVFTATVILSALVGYLAVQGLAADTMSYQQELWFASAIGGQAGPLLVDMVRRFLFPALPGN